MRLAFIFVFALLTGMTAHSQEDYATRTRAADSLFLEKAYRPAVNLYEEAFRLNNGLGKVGDRYKAAVCFSFLDIADSAFVELDIMVSRGKFSRFDMLETDPGFLPLRSDPRWQAIIDRARQNAASRRPN